MPSVLIDPLPRKLVRALHNTILLGVLLVDMAATSVNTITAFLSHPSKLQTPKADNCCLSIVLIFLPLVSNLCPPPQDRVCGIMNSHHRSAIRLWLAFDLWLPANCGYDPQSTSAWRAHSHARVRRFCRWPRAISYGARRPMILACSRSSTERTRRVIARLFSMPVSAPISDRVGWSTTLCNPARNRLDDNEAP